MKFAGVDAPVRERPCPFRELDSPEPNIDVGEGLYPDFPDGFVASAPLEEGSVLTSIPDKLWILCHPPSNRYGCFDHEGVHGMASFLCEFRAIQFADWIVLSGMRTEEVSFQEARRIALERPYPVTSLMVFPSAGWNPTIIPHDRP